VDRVAHYLSVGDYIAVGRDLEAQVLAHAVKWHAEHRVLLNGLRTVVFQ
jgi:formyltetrahydrofolate deformylase